MSQSAYQNLQERLVNAALAWAMGGEDHELRRVALEVLAHHRRAEQEVLVELPSSRPTERVRPTSTRLPSVA